MGRSWSVLIATTVALGLGVTVAGPAAAATPNCNNWDWHTARTIKNNGYTLAKGCVGVTRSSKNYVYIVTSVRGYNGFQALIESKKNSGSWVIRAHDSDGDDAALVNKKFHIKCTAGNGTTVKFDMQVNNGQGAKFATYHC